MVHERSASEADKQVADRLSKLVGWYRKGVTRDGSEDRDGQPVPVG